MKVLHAAALLRPPAGIINQMRWEQLAADELGLDWTSKVFCPAKWAEPERVIHASKTVRANQTDSSLKKLRDWIWLRREYHLWLKSQEKYFDIFVLRYYVHDPFQYEFVKNCRKPVFFVHHTLEGPELAGAGSMSSLARSAFEKALGGPTISKSTGIIGVTDEIIEYERKRANVKNKKVILYPNGIIMNDPPVEDKRREVPEFLFVAGYFSPWHGLDLLLKDMRTNNKNFVLHLVGNLSDSDRKVAESDHRIVRHGMKTHSEIREIAATCWAGLSSFALYRNNMHQACTLKVREYLMMGLPVLSGYEDVFSSDMKYYRRIEPSVEDLLQFSNEIINYSRLEVRDCSRKQIDKVTLLKSLNNSLLDHLRGEIC